MTKLEMAHEFAMKLAELKVTNKTEDIIRLGWEYADAMQAEADKRGTVQHTRSGHTVTTYERPAVLQDEWQPDWSVAPVWANYWMLAPNGGANWLSNHPSSDPLIVKAWGAPSFNYQGSWEDSLRKRP